MMERRERREPKREVFEKKDDRQSGAPKYRRRGEKIYEEPPQRDDYYDRRGKRETYERRPRNN